MLALGLSDHEVTPEAFETGAALPGPRFNSPAIAYVWAAELKKKFEAGIAELRKC